MFNVFLLPIVVQNIEAKQNEVFKTGIAISCHIFLMQIIEEKLFLFLFKIIYICFCLCLIKCRRELFVVVGSKTIFAICCNGSVCFGSHLLLFIFLKGKPVYRKQNPGKKNRKTLILP